MPKSKRNKQVELAKTKKRGLDWKKHLVEEVRSCADKYANIFVFSVNDMRNSKMKNVREQWKHSRFFIGKNKIMSMALGRFAEEEYKPNLHKLGQQIKGQCGLLFSNKTVEEVLSWFRSYSEGDYARSGNTATETVNLTAGPLTMFPHNLEPYLRQLGLPTSLEKGVIHLIRDHEVCKEGDVLTPDTAKILKLLGYEMAEFHVTINCVWSQDGSFMQFTETVDTDAKENKKVKKSSLGSKPTVKTNSVDEEEMEVELEESADESEEDVVNNVSDTKSDLNGTLLNKAVGAASTPKEKSNGFIENTASHLPEEDDNMDPDDQDDITSDTNEDDAKSDLKGTLSNEVDAGASTPKEKSNGFIGNTASHLPEEDDKLDPDDEDDITSDANEDVAKSDLKGTLLNDAVAAASTPKEKSSGFIENTTSQLPEDDKSDSECKIAKVQDDITSDASENTTKSSKKRDCPRSVAKTPKMAKSETKRESLMKTPDANTSQDSPVFRQLRNRSVKVNRKRK